MRPHRWLPSRLPRPWDSGGKNTGVGCHFLLQCVKVKSESEVAQSCPTLSDPMDHSLPGSSTHGIFQARVLEWGAIAFSDTGILFNHKNKIMPFAATWVQLEMSVLSEVRKRKTNTIWCHFYVESKIWHKWPYLLRNRKTLTDIENRLVVAKGKGGGRERDGEFGISRCKLLYIEWINYKVPTL